MRYKFKSICLSFEELKNIYGHREVCLNELIYMVHGVVLNYKGQFIFKNIFEQ